MTEFGGRGQLKANFVCSRCRHWARDNPIQWAFTMSRLYRNLQWELKNEMMLFETNAYNQSFPQRAETFKNNMDALLAKRHIKKYDFVVEENKLIAILIHDVPFIGSYKIELYETTKKKEPTQTQPVP